MMTGMDTMPAAILLDGVWETGLDRRYDATVQVPGLADDPARPSAGTRCYRRRITLPAGGWSGASLLMRGARFRPRVLVDGEEVAAAPGGMAAILLPLVHPALRPGRTVQLEIILASLTDVPAADASCLPQADHWRSNVSSCLWDSVELHLHGPAALAWIGVDRDPGDGAAILRWRCAGMPTSGTTLRVRLATIAGEADAASGILRLPGAAALAAWSPESPVLHRLEAELLVDGALSDRRSQDVGLRRLELDGLRFRLNGRPWTMRAGTVVWHRFVRDPEARQLAWDAEWFLRAVIRPLKALGANALRFHLGMPPRRLLELCDREGLAVQAEWCAFHGLNGSEDSLAAQWGDWIGFGSEHPACVLWHAWNETDGALLAKGFAALRRVAVAMPPLVLAHRDTIHLHKYWWSLFENVGCYYDDAVPFGKAVVSDEFGGNYLDGAGDPGGYGSLRGALSRFLGCGHDAAQRLKLQGLANGRIAEYWRRLDIAGFSPFCIAGSREDGNHHFLGPLAEARPKPVWQALSAAYAASAASLDAWDQHALPGSAYACGLWLGNDTGDARELQVELRVVGPDGAPRWSRRLVERVAAHGRRRLDLAIPLPDACGTWRVEARTLAPQPPAGPPVSAWEVTTLRPADRSGLAWTRLDDGLRLDPLLGHTEADARLLIGGAATWARLAAGDRTLMARIDAALAAGRHVVLLEAGPRWLGSSYDNELAYRQADGIPPIPPRHEDLALPGGLGLRLSWLPEPETFLHEGEDGALLAGLPGGMPRLWNGLRGGIVAPAIDLELSGLGPEAFLAQWVARGVDPAVIRAGTCTAYELHGHWRFAAAHDPAVEGALREHIRFLHADAPALAHVLDPRARIRRIDLGAGFRAAAGRAERISARLHCGADLMRAPVLTASFPGGGRLSICQLLSEGRLTPERPAGGAWEARYDPALVQLIGNLLADG
jgi:hypothetical protein